MAKTKKTQGNMSSLRFWILIWGMGLAGQLCWNMENQWFNTFVYAKISGDVNIVSWMVIVSALVTTISTFVFGTLSDRMGKRKMFVSMGYIIWGCTTILFGMTEYARNSGVGVLISLSGFLVVLTDAIMSFFGSMGCDCGYNVWVNDYTNDSNKGQIGAALAVLPASTTARLPWPGKTERTPPLAPTLLPMVSAARPARSTCSPAQSMLCPVSMALLACEARPRMTPVRP